MNEKSLLEKVCEKLDKCMFAVVDGLGRIAGGIANLEPLSPLRSVGACFLAVFVWGFAISINFWA